MLLYHGSNEIVRTPEILVTEYTKDFGWGFYTTQSQTQAARWARRRALKGGIATVNLYEYTPCETLETKAFDGTTPEWLHFVALCRQGKPTPHDYDIVSGPMADDEIWTYVDQYLSGEISEEAFLAICKFKHPTQQTSFHTLSALKTLTFIRAEEA